MACCDPAGKLSYFQKEDDAGKKPLGIILLRDMIEVRSTLTEAKKSKEKKFRFELETNQRTWFFSADSAQDLTSWMMTLQLMIMKYVASPDDASIGGRMANPDKACWLKMKDNTLRDGWNRRYAQPHEP